jgi:transposase
VSKQVRKKRRSFTREFKLSALRRMAKTDSIVGLARELGVERKLLYCWREQYQSGGSEALRRVGRPVRRAAEQDGFFEASGNLSQRADGNEPATPGAPEQRIEALQRKIGEQQLELDFFRAALQQVRARRRGNGAPGEKASTP